MRSLKAVAFGIEHPTQQPGLRRLTLLSVELGSFWLDLLTYHQDPREGNVGYNAALSACGKLGSARKGDTDIRRWRRNAATNHLLSRRLSSGRMPQGS